MIYYKVTSGLALELCMDFCRRRREAFARIDEVCRKYGATPGRTQSCGSKVEGLHFGATLMTPKGWTKSRMGKGYFVPSRKTKPGQVIAADIDALSIPSTEKLARDLGCKPFFMDFDEGQTYCANIGVMEHDGVCYLEAHKWCPPDQTRFSGIVQIQASEWHAADEAREAARVKAAAEATT